MRAPRSCFSTRTVIRRWSCFAFLGVFWPIAFAWAQDAEETGAQNFQEDQLEPAPEIEEETSLPTPSVDGNGQERRRQSPTRPEPPPRPASASDNVNRTPSSPTPDRTAVVSVGDDDSASDAVPEGQELVNIDFPEPTDIKDIIRAVSLWTGKNVILGRDVNGKVQMISPRRVTKEEAYQAFLSALNLLGLTTVETGKVIKILPTRGAVKGNLKTYLGSSWTPLTDEMITQIVPLKYIDAKEIQTTLSRIITSNSMIAYRPTNTLIISDSGYKVRRILDIIEILDVQGQQPQLSIVPIKFADAKTIADKVQEIFKARSGNRSKGGSEYLSHKLITDERTNSVIIFGPPRTIADVKALVKRFDIRVTDPSRQATIHVRPLDYADAKKLAATLSALATGNKANTSTRRPPISPAINRAQGRGGAAPGGGDTAAAVAEFDDNLKITADESSNSLLITGSRAAYEAINSIIRKLDIRKSQVFVEGHILDVKMDGGFKAGGSIFAGQGSENGSKLAYTWDANKLGGLLAAQVINQQPGRLPTDQSISSAVSSFAQDFNIGILAGYRVDLPGIGKISPGLLINLVKKDSATRDLASPSILIANNEEAEFTVGEKLFYQAPGDIAMTSQVIPGRIEHENVNLTLQLKPNISHSNYVTMQVDLTADTGQLDRERGVPSVANRKLKQNVTVKTGQTVVISGLMKTHEAEVYSRIPLLGDVPILGWLFRNSSIEKVRTNLMLFLTPNIVHGADDLAAIYQRKMDEQDEFFKAMFGGDYAEKEFYKLLPKREDGLFRSDSLDEAEKRLREERERQMRVDMGMDVSSAAGVSGAAAGPEDEEVPSDMEESTTTLPFTGQDGEDFGGDVGDVGEGGADLAPLEPMEAEPLDMQPPADFEGDGGAGGFDE